MPLSAHSTPHAPFFSPSASLHFARRITLAGDSGKRRHVSWEEEISLIICMNTTEFVEGKRKWWGSDQTQ